MRTKEIFRLLDEWAPPKASWEKDNVGLQVGSGQEDIQNVLICLELTKNVLQDAIKKNCNLIITHHPFIFTPIKNINTSSDIRSQLIYELIKNDITLFSAHTNLDFTKDGVSFQLAYTLNLQNVNFLKINPIISLSYQFLSRKITLRN